MESKKVLLALYLVRFISEIGLKVRFHSLLGETVCLIKLDRLPLFSCFQFRVLEKSGCRPESLYCFLGLSKYSLRVLWNIEFPFENLTWNLESHSASFFRFLALKAVENSGILLETVELNPTESDSWSGKLNCLILRLGFFLRTFLLVLLEALDLSKLPRSTKTSFAAIF